MVSQCSRRGRCRLLTAGHHPQTPLVAGTGHVHGCLRLLAPLPAPSSDLRPPDPQAVTGRGAHEGVDPAAASAASRLSHSFPRRRGQGRSMSAKPQEKAALEPETRAMPEKRAGAQAAGGSSVSMGRGPAALFSSRLLVKGGWAGSRSESEAASERCPDSPPGVREDADRARRLWAESQALGSPSFSE